MAEDEHFVKGLQARASRAFSEPDREGQLRPDREGVARADDKTRLLEIFDQHYDFVWRSLRRLGVRSENVDDGAQRVFMIVASRLEQIEVGREVSFLYGTARRVASDLRASQRLDETRRDELDLEAPGARQEVPDALLEMKQARERLDALLDCLDVDLRTVFVLFELEGMRAAEIAALLDIPPGTVASRLRRAREAMSQLIAQLENAAREA